VIGMTVCSGIGAPEVSAPWIDWRYQSEIEAFPSAVLAHRFPNAVNLGDMTRFEEWPNADVDVLCGGTPCQSFSVAGLRKGLDDARGNLMLTYLAIARRYSPRWLVWENVPGVLSSNGGRDFGSFLGGLGQLGYGFAYRVLDAQYVRTCGLPFAVPQRRRRVFVVGYLGDWRRAAAVLFDAESLRGHPPPRREAGKGVAPTIAARTRCGGGLGTDFDCDGGLIAHDVAPTLNAHFGDKMGLENQHINGGCGHFVAHALRGEGFDASEDGTGRGTPLVPVVTDTLTSNGDAHSEFRDERGLVPIARNAVRAVAFLGQAVNGNQGSGGNRAGLDPDHPHTCLTRSGKPNAIGLNPPYAVRRLTPLECERLQGFPDGWTQIPYRGKPAELCPDGPRYKALGNSWAVNCGEWIFNRIRMVEGMANA